jgi:IS4 transposase
MSATSSGSESPYIHVGKNWAVPDEDEYGELAGKAVHYCLEYDGDEQPSVADIAANVQIVPFSETGPETQEYGPSNRMRKYEHVPDDRAAWHRNTIPIKNWMRIHAFALAREWDYSDIHEWATENKEKTKQFGFTEYDEELDRHVADPPSKSRLSEIWENKFTKAEQTICEKLSEELFLIAFNHSLPLPRDSFEPDKKRGESKRTERRLIEERSWEIYRQTAPIIKKSFYLDRADNARVPEGSFWEAHAKGGLGADTYTEGAVDAFRQDTTRPADQLHTGRTHRHHIQKHSVEQMRSMFHDAVKRLAKHARHSGELQGKLCAAIDTTKGSPWTGDIEWVEGDRRNRPKNPHLLGYNNDDHEKYSTTNYYFQWITIQIVGLDIPLVLDAIPLRRGYTTAEHVSELLSNAVEIVPDLDFVMFDRAFDSDEIKDVCDEHGVYYLNPARKYNSEKKICARLHRRGKKLAINKEKKSNVPDRYRIYVPAENEEIHKPVDADDYEESISTKTELNNDKREEGFREKLGEEFSETVDVDFESDRNHGFGDVIEEIAEEEDILSTSEGEADAYALFETNHPALSTDFEEEERLLSSVEAFLERYSNRWGIENGFKQLKQFRVRTTSDNHAYRFFNFLFSCLLYNAWRIVDILVKLAFDDDPEYSPRVKAQTFMTMAKQNLGKGPPR